MSSQRRKATRPPNAPTAGWSPDAIRGEYYRDPTQELDQALSRGIDRGVAKMLKDERMPPAAERPVVALTCLAIRDGEVAIAHTLPVHTYIGTKTGIALVPDPPFWENEQSTATAESFFGHGQRISFQLFSARLADGDLVAVCSSALAQSLPPDRLEQWLTGGEMRVLSQGMRTQYLKGDTEPAYALVVQARPDVREKAGSPVQEEARTHPRPKLRFAGLLSLGSLMSRFGPRRSESKDGESAVSHRRGRAADQRRRCAPCRRRRKRCGVSHSKAFNETLTQRGESSAHPAHGHRACRHRAAVAAFQGCAAFPVRSRTRNVPAGFRPG